MELKTWAMLLMFRLDGDLMKGKIFKVIALCVVIGLCLLFNLPVEVGDIGGVI